MNTFWQDHIINDWPVLLLALVAAVAVHWVSYKLVRHLVSHTHSESVQFAFRMLRFPTLTALILVAFTIAYNTLPLKEDTQALLNHVSGIVLIITIAWALVSAVKIFRKFTLRKYDVTVKDNRLARTKLTQFKVLERIVIAIIAIVATGAILMTFETIQNIGASLLASAGIAGIIIGFAAQRSIATFLAGIQIAITQPIRLEDAVVVEGEWGWIEEITFTYVVVRIWDLRRLVVPINYFIEQPFQNWTRESANILGSVFLYTDYTVKVDDLREELDRILETTDKWDGKVKVVQVTDATERTMLIRILVSAVDSPTAWDLRVFVREKMIAFLQENYPESLPRSRVEVQDVKGKDFFGAGEKED